MQITPKATSIRRAKLANLAAACALVIVCAAPLHAGHAVSATTLQRSTVTQTPGHPAQFRVVRSLCGSKGASHGNDFQIEDPKNEFHPAEDRQIIVYFEWEGPPGSQHAEGIWRSPDGKAMVTSDFDLASQGTHYTGYWTLAIPETIATGLWALEATIDGQPAGTQTFRIVSDRSAAPTAAGPPPPPSPGEVYQRASAASVFVTSLDAEGEPITRGFGFFVDKNSVLTAFQVVDGATSLRIDFADGVRTVVYDVVAWNRPADWAILKVDSDKVQPLERAAPDSWRVGDLCYVLTSQGQGSRTIQSVSLTGLQGSTKSSQRLTLSEFGGQGILGAPLLDRYGRVIGLLSGGLAGMGSSRMGNWTAYLDPGQGITAIADLTVLPLAQIPPGLASQPASTLADLATHGALEKPLPQVSQVITGSFCEDFRRVGDDFMPLRTTRSFSRARGNLALVVAWAPLNKLKGMQQLRVYDLNNQPVLQTTPSKIELQPRVTNTSAWKLPLASVPPGIYRVDVLLNDEPQWREFFQLVE
jgi:hypothetical protein